MADFSSLKEKKLQEQSAIILIGPQGSGKGTVAEFIKLFGFYHVEVGEKLRGNPEVQSYVNSGRLCPDHIVSKVIENEVRLAHDKHVIFDGAPRTGSQVDIVCKSLNSYNRIFVFLECGFITSVERIKSRVAKTNKQHLIRLDDLNMDAIHRRLNDYFINKDHILEELEKRKEAVISIDAGKTPEEVRLQFVTDVCPLIFSGVYA